MQKKSRHLPGSSCLYFQLHNVHSFYESGSLKWKDQRQPLPVRNDSNDQGSSGSEKNQPPNTSVLFCIFHGFQNLRKNKGGSLNQKKLYFFIF